MHAVSLALVSHTDESNGSTDSNGRNEHTLPRPREPGIIRRTRVCVRAMDVDVCTSTRCIYIYTACGECGESRSGEKANGLSQILSIAVCLSGRGRKSGRGRARRYRMKCLLHSQPLFMPMPRFDHLANSVVARQARQTEAFRATPRSCPPPLLPALYSSLFAYLRLRPPSSSSPSPFSFLPLHSLSLLVLFARSLPPFFPHSPFSPLLSLLCSPAAVSPPRDNVSGSINAKGHFLSFLNLRRRKKKKGKKGGGRKGKKERGKKKYTFANTRLIRGNHGGTGVYFSAQESRLGQETRKLFESRVRKEKRRARIVCKNIGFGESIPKSRINIRIPQISLISLLSNTNLETRSHCSFVLSIKIYFIIEIKILR